MPECDYCGEFVSNQWKRVMAIDGVIKGCPDCMSQGELLASR